MYNISMRIIADLQIHSKYSRACSQDLVPVNISAWAQKKGIGIIGTGDFTHPGWLTILKDELIETKPGLFSLRNDLGIPPSSALNSASFRGCHLPFYAYRRSF
jgi:hypothetical protein